MRLPAKSIALLLPLLLTGCFHRAGQQQVKLAPPVEDAPPPKVTSTPANLPPPVVTPPVEPAKPSDNASASAPAPKPAPKHRKPAKTPPIVPTENTEVSAVGQLTTGDASDIRKQTVDAIAALEHNLNSITRDLNDQEQKTAAQIKEFLKQAREALTSGDVDGARTLAVKAKVLLGELNQ
jgi:hypothetical protein